MEELEVFAHVFVSTLKPHTERATIVALHGELGAGKTSFVQSVARVYGITENVTSPTFVILKRYPLTGTLFTNLIHIDAYRLESGRELEVLGWGELVQNPKNIIFIEWAERVKDVFPKDIINLSFEYKNERVRIVTVNEKMHGKENR